jgi:hypothetical protein
MGVLFAEQHTPLYGVEIIGVLFAEHTPLYRFKITLLLFILFWWNDPAQTI